MSTFILMVLNSLCSAFFQELFSKVIEDYRIIMEVLEYMTIL